VKTLLLGIAMAVLAPPPVQAQSIAGEWDAGMNTPGGVRNFKIVFQVKGDSLTGTVKRQTGDAPLVGTIKGDTVAFSYSIAYNDNTLTLTVTAIVTGDTMKGTVDFGGAASDEFWAKRAAAPPGGEAQRDGSRRS